MRKIINVSPEVFEKMNEFSTPEILFEDMKELPLLGGLESFRKTKTKIIIDDIGIGSVKMNYLILKN